MTTETKTTVMKGMNMTGGTKPTAKTDAISMLKKDHREIENAFSEFEKLSTKDSLQTKKSLADHIGKTLLTHMALEEDIFYPTVKKRVEAAEDSVNEGIVEHASARDVINQILKMKGNEELFDTKVNVLSELVEHHVEEEEKEMFPKVEDSDIDLEALGREMSDYKAKL